MTTSSPYFVAMPQVSQHVLKTRGSGLSTVQALTVLATSVANPGAKVAILDHFGPEADDMLAEMVRNLRTACGLEITVSRWPDGKWYAQAGMHGAKEAQYVQR